MSSIKYALCTYTHQHSYWAPNHGGMGVSTGYTEFVPLTALFSVRFHSPSSTDRETEVEQRQVSHLRSRSQQTESGLKSKALVKMSPCITQGVPGFRSWLQPPANVQPGRLKMTPLPHEWQTSTEFPALGFGVCGMGWPKWELSICLRPSAPQRSKAF